MPQSVLEEIHKLPEGCFNRFKIRLRSFLNNFKCTSQCCQSECDKNVVIVGKDYNENYLPKK